jgi:hypothetical protein
MLLPRRVFAQEDAKAVLFAGYDRFPLARAARLRLLLGLLCFVGFVGHHSASYKSTIFAFTSAIAASIASILIKVRQVPMR